ncbi:hypothetical protein JXQ31_18835 [candidate division KSB1 bacterium]|nr:hypothetical protein [candidate division KSB1 bacterium]
MGILVPIILFIVIGWIIKVLSDNHTKNLLIEKEMVNESVKFLYTDRMEKYVPSSLKWGMVLIAVGLAIFLGKILTEVPGIMMRTHDEEAIIFALMFIFGGLALIIYYSIAVKMMKKEEEKEALKK